MLTLGGQTVTLTGIAAANVTSSLFSDPTAVTLTLDLEDERDGGYRSAAGSAATRSASGWRRASPPAAGPTNVATAVGPRPAGHCAPPLRRA